MTLTPAYGRDYKSAKAVKEAFNDNKDFVFNLAYHVDNGRVVNKEQIPAGTRVVLRYNKFRSVTTVTV